MKMLNRNEVKDGAKKPIKVLQFGEGNFLRAFTDWMFDIISEKTDFNAGIQIIQPIKNGMGELINAQDGLYHVLLEGIENAKKIQTFRLITCVNGVTNPYEDYSAFLALGENPELEFIISNTTEAGIEFSSKDKNFSIPPKTFPGKLTALLYHRFQHFNSYPPKGLTILPCELIENNGQKLKECILQYADLWSLPMSFQGWIAKDILFCNTLVDRIVPGFPGNRIDKLQKVLGYNDQLIVNAEYFHLWVIEGPQFLKEILFVDASQLNIIVTDNLEKYRTRKVRILNGAHTAMVGYGLINGFKKVKDVVEHETAGQFIRDLIFKEIIPSIEMEKTELESYAKDVLERFQNPYIKHYLQDISLNSISKFKVRVLPSLLSYIHKFNKVPTGLATAFAYLIYLYRGNHQELKISLKDDEKYIMFFNNVWQSGNAKQITENVLSNIDMWGENLSERQELRSFISMKLEEIAQDQA
jgi:tagaturonate reductase